MKRFDGRAVLITGAASGFGAAAARRFAAEGAKLALGDITGEPLEALADELRDAGVSVVTEVIDVTREDDAKRLVDACVDAHGGLYAALNNAGIGGGMAPIVKTTAEDFDRVMAVNTRGVFLGMKYQLPVMMEAREGAILNTASAAGVVGAGHVAAYAASKHAVVGLTRSGADEAARYNVRVNAMCPSFSPTPLFNEMADYVGGARGMSRQDAYTHIASRIPMRRVATVDEVVQAMLWACDPENSFMTGQTVQIDGGLTAV